MLDLTSYTAPITYMSTNLSALIDNNDCPSDSARQEVKELLSEPYKQLAETNAEMVRLEGLVHEVQQKQAEIRQAIERYTKILAPIRRVPLDVLCEIFAHCLPAHRNPTTGAWECPMLLTRVCSIWRALALASPELWARIHIPFQPDLEGSIYRSYAGEREISSDEVTRTLRLRTDAAREWLSRSGECPLSISIAYFWGDGCRESDAYRSLQSVMPLLKNITLLSSRWRSFELTAPLEIYHQLEHLLSGRNLSNLVCLRVSIDVHRMRRQDALRPSLDLFKSQNLKNVSFELLPPPDILPQAIFVPQQTITYLSCKTFYIIQELIPLLKSCPNLIHGSFSIRFDDALPTETVEMQCLTSLRITAEVSEAPLNNVYDFIRVPHLQCVEYGYRDDVDYQVGPQINIASSSLLPLIERSPVLNWLVIDRYTLTSDTIIRLLSIDSLCSLVKLVLQSPPRFSSRERHFDPFDLQCLVAQKNSRKVLLPRLEDFELYATQDSEETILQFITSRMGTLPDIAILKRVKITLDRLRDPRGIDIDVQVGIRAQELGIKVVLVVEYPTPVAHIEGYVDQMSPSFIPGYKRGKPLDSTLLHKAEKQPDYTWQHRELEDEDGFYD